MGRGNGMLSISLLYFSQISAFLLLRRFSQNFHPRMAW